MIFGWILIGILLLYRNWVTFFNLRIMKTRMKKAQIRSFYCTNIRLGGAELLFGNKKFHTVDLPEQNKPWIIGDLLIWIKDNMLQERPELFLQDKSVRPGILVLVNDADWELMDTVDYKVQPNDKITFISTLHGG